uniref:Vesicle-associated protein 1-2 isoform X3 n=1 Tax=Rhizophora mucronata TaxID=61149 RepID=A0A2P2J9V4_RHIMU
MSSKLLEIQPKQLEFIVESKRQSSCSVRLTNNTFHSIAFKVKTTSPRKYSVRPNVGIVLPKSSFEFIVTMQAQKAASLDMLCNDKFLIQSTVVPAGTMDMEITPLMFAKDDGKFIEEVKLKVVLISPPQSPVLLPINQEFREGLFSDAPVRKDQILKKIEILSPSCMHEDAKDGGFKHINGQWLFTTEKDLELNPKMDVANGQDLKPANDAELTSNNDIADVDELKWAKDEQLKLDKDAVDNEQEKLVEDSESSAVKDEEFTIMKALDELKLVADIEEMKSKLNFLESKLIEAESTISKLKEERQLGTEDRKILIEELVSSLTDSRLG